MAKAKALVLYEETLRDYHTAPKHLREIVAQDLRKARSALREDTIRAALRRCDKPADPHAASEKLIDQIARTARMRGFEVEDRCRGYSYFSIRMKRPLPKTLGEAYFDAEVWYSGPTGSSLPRLRGRETRRLGVVLITQTDKDGNIKRSREVVSIENAKKFMAECLEEDWS